MLSLGRVKDGTLELIGSEDGRRLGTWEKGTPFEGGRDTEGKFEDTSLAYEDGGFEDANWEGIDDGSSESSIEKVTLGTADGARVGTVESLATSDGLEVSVTLGTAEGERLGVVESVPPMVGRPLGDEEGTFEERFETRTLGSNDGVVDRDRCVGVDVGACEPDDTVTLGASDGARLGAVESVPSMLGMPLGDEEGKLDTRSKKRTLGSNEGVVDCNRFVGVDDGGCEREATLKLGTAEGE